MLARTTALTHATLSVYRAALNTLWVEEAIACGASHLPNPVEDRIVARVLAGIEREKLPSLLAARNAAPRPVAMTAELLEALRPYFEGADPHSVMLWAAALTATYGLFRPNELFGSAQNPDRALRPDAVTFFSHPRSRAVAGIPPPHADIGSIALPDRFSIRLGITKADPRAKNPDHPVAAPAAVRALWRWMHLRAKLGPGAADRVFQIPGSPPLSLRALTGALSTALSTHLGRPTRVLGRSFRQGGATTLLEGGAERADIAAMGRWKGVNMIPVYASAASQNSRAAAASRAMGPKSASPRC